MEIREPKYAVGDKVVETDKQSDNIWTVQKIHGYDFTFDSYAYCIKNDDGMTLVCDEIFLKPYIKPKTVWDLKKGDTCYAINTFEGNTYQTTFYGNGYDLGKRELGNCFLTQEEAEIDVERRRIEVEMLRLGGRRKYKNNKANWMIIFDYDEYCIEFSYMSNSKTQGSILFDSKEQAQKVVNEIGEDKIRKYIFEVEE